MLSVPSSYPHTLQRHTEDGEELRGQGGFPGGWSLFILKEEPVPGGSELWGPSQSVSDGVFRPLYLTAYAAAVPRTGWPVIGGFRKLPPPRYMGPFFMSEICMGVWASERT